MRPTCRTCVRLAEQARYVTSVCTGSLLLGAAGLLRGRRAACHWAFRELLPLFGAIPETARVVRDGNIFSGGGVTAGIDMALDGGRGDRRPRRSPRACSSRSSTRPSRPSPAGARSWRAPPVVQAVRRALRMPSGPSAARPLERAAAALASGSRGALRRVAPPGGVC